MNGLGKASGNKSNPKKSKKQSKSNKWKFPHVNKKSLERKQIFVQTSFSHSTLKIQPKIHAAKPVAFRSTSCFGVTKITTPI